MIRKTLARLESHHLTVEVEPDEVVEDALDVPVRLSCLSLWTLGFLKQAL